MLRAAWRALSSVRAQAVTQAPVPALRSRSSANLPSARCSLQPPSEPPSWAPRGWAKMVDTRHRDTGERQ